MMLNLIRPVTVLLFSSLFSAEAVEVKPCPDGSILSEKQYQIHGTRLSSFALRIAPDVQSERVLNEKASRLLKKPHYVTIDRTVKVVENCSFQGWSRVQVVKPRGMRLTHQGWIEQSRIVGAK